MPEGHTVHRVANFFRDEFVGRAVATSSPQGRFHEGATLLNGHTVDDAYAVGKQLFVDFSGGLVLRVHLGIYGAWSVRTRSSSTAIGAPRVDSVEEGLRTERTENFPPEPIGQVRLRVATESVVADLRGPTACEVLSPEQAGQVIDRLGPDPLVDTPARGLRRFRQRMNQTRTPISVALMNQQLVSGIGNVYRAELLFRHRLDPFVPASALSDDILASVWKDWTVLLKAGVKTGVMVTRNDLTPSQAKRALREARLRHYVYKRHGKPCLVCNEPVQLTEIAGRKLYWCGSCQVEPSS